MSGTLNQISKYLKGPVKGLLLDITGVLYESGSGKAIDGSVDAISKLRKLGVPFRFVTNESQSTRKALVAKLQSYGFTLKEDEIFAPAPAVAKMLEKQQLRPFLLVHPDVKSEFANCDVSSPNCVVIGDAAEYFTYDILNDAFRLLKSLQEPILISMGKGMYYKEKGALVLDVGAFTSVLEYALGIKAIVIGKPSKEYFCSALDDMGIKPTEAVMIGDDINSDVGAAQNCGMQGVLVRTGKYTPQDENHPSVTPNAIVDNLATFIDTLPTLQ